jgi:hypothetical protein
MASMSELDTRLAYAAAQDHPQPGPSAAAHADREARLAADEAQLRMPMNDQPHGREILSYHEGRPTVAEQMTSHGAAPPKVPDVGGRG